MKSVNFCLLPSVIFLLFLLFFYPNCKLVGNILIIGTTRKKSLQHQHSPIINMLRSYTTMTYKSSVFFSCFYMFRNVIEALLSYILSVG
jgi:hypothetical protein